MIAKGKINQELELIFNSLDTECKGFIRSSDFWDILDYNGIKKSDIRLKSVRESLSDSDDMKIDFSLFLSLISDKKIIIRALKGELVIPDFKDFVKHIEGIFNKLSKVKDGECASYIPQLARVDPDKFAISICTIDGQMCDFGNYNESFSVQSVCKPINYCIAHDELGSDKVHEHVGREPSGRSFNEMALNQEGLPHNPLINSGAIMTTSLIKPKEEMCDRFDFVLNFWKSLSGGLKPTFNNSIYLSERSTADRNFALGYFMRENNAFPEGTKLHDTLEFYFQCCAVEMNTNSLANVASTFANGGVQPKSGLKIFNSQTIKDCLSIMNSCGMYDFSGEHAFRYGIPAKSGVSGSMFLVIPNVMGIAIWSPRLDKIGNTIRGTEFTKEITKIFNFHNYDNLIINGNKTDPTKRKYKNEVSNTQSLIWAASKGDILEIQRLEASGVDLNYSDYDGRTALHLAASEGRLDVVKFLSNRNNIKIDPKDRWGNTPMDEAKKGSYNTIVNFLKKVLSK